MKRFLNLYSHWEICQHVVTEKICENELEILATKPGTLCGNVKWLETNIPAQVHEILIKHGKIDDPVQTLNYAACQWVSDCDWIYRKEFDKPLENGKMFLHFKGLDTIVDIYLNGVHIAYHNDMFIPLRLEITDQIKDKNILLLHFHSPWEYVRSIEIPEEWQGKIEPKKFIRKAPEDMGDFLGAKPYLTVVGVYDEILLEIVKETEISGVDIDYELSYSYESAELMLQVEGQGVSQGVMIEVIVKDLQGDIVASRKKPLPVCDQVQWKHTLELAVNEVKLWWPKGYGEQPLYEVIVEVSIDGLIQDSVTKRIGFRDLVMVGPFDYLINDKKVKLWGGNLVPVNGITHCWDREKTFKLLDLAENCNFNTLRVWGGGEPYSDEFYEECDRRGILLWVEFFHIWGMYPEHEEYRELCRKEATYLVSHLKHHPSIFMWCGGNESIMGTEYENYENPVTYIGTPIFEEDYKIICQNLDPKRLYIPNSPYGGSFTNDPKVLDTHGYTHMYYVPGYEYPLMLSENTRISIPVLKSMKKFIGMENLWPEEFDGRVFKAGDSSIPEPWFAISTGQIIPRIRYVERFYDSDTPEALIYRFGAARSFHIRDTVERCRRGRPSNEPMGERRTKGHYMWKFNDTWPQIYCSMLDYFMEPYMPYYALKRAHEPLLLSFDVQDHINLWLVNDTSKYVEGTLYFKLHSIKNNRTVREYSEKVVVPSGESRVVMNLDRLGQFSRDHILYATLMGSKGEIMATSYELVDLERNLYFPDATISMIVLGDYLKITTDKYARCIEISGSEDGDEFGWLFEDNYFDLLPGEVKRVRVMGRHMKGKISAKAYYSPQTAMVEYDLSEC